jgi:D-lactate dehydrogenase (cytochrome)
MDAPLLQPLEADEYLRDESRRRGHAQAIAFPRTEEQLLELLVLAHQSATPLTIQGARTGISAGAVPQGGYIVNLSRLNRFCGMRFDPARQQFFLSVQPGVLLSQIRTALEEKSFDTSGWESASLDALHHFTHAPAHFFAPDPTETSASIGGMVACNASGARTFFYGPTARFVEALRIVFVNGERLWLRRGEQRAQGRRFSLRCESGFCFEGELPSYTTPSVKSAAGYRVSDDMDLVDLFIGMEGTLGVITAVELRLEPLARHWWGVMTFFPSLQGALHFVRTLRTERSTSPAVGPVAIELFNERALALLRHQKINNPAFAQLPALPTAPHTAVYVEYQGAQEDGLAEQLEQLVEWLADCGGAEELSWVAESAAEMERMKFFRHAVPEAVNLLIDERRKSEPSLTKLGTDMAVPDHCLEEVMGMYERDLSASGLESVIFGHIGNNHVHVNIIPRSLQDYEQGRELYGAWAQQVVGWGGSVSAEHGIGKLKTGFLELMYGTGGVEQMRALKRVFDEQSLLNRGTLFTL